MTKTLFLWRHGKAEEASLGADHGRALMPHGLTDARHAAAWMMQQNVLPEMILCSTSERTRQTLAALPAMIPVQLLQRLYLASAEDLLQMVQQADDAENRLMLVGHNPGLHRLAVALIGSAQHAQHAARLQHKFSTGVLAIIQFNSASWQNVREGAGVLEHFYDPREDR